MPRSSDQHQEEREANRQAIEMARRMVITMVANLMVTIKKPKKDDTIEDVLTEAEEVYDEFFGTL